MTTKQYFLPQSAAEAVQLLAEYGPSLLIMAGGTIAMPLINEGISFPERVMGLRQAGLSGVVQANGHVAVGACTTLSQVMAWGEIPALREAARSVGAWAIRNMGTVGGNLFAPPPAGDLAVMLLALDAQVKLVSVGGERLVPLADFYTGFLATVLEPGELVTAIQVPLPQGKTVFRKFGRRQTNTPAVVTVAAHVVLAGHTVRDARIALGAVGPHPLRSRQAEASLIGATLDDEAIAQAAALAAEECQPGSDPIASEWYRRKMTAVMVRHALQQIAN
ncbi:MAG: FAD binding domain-containing protein [Chloroflexi bacterium]|nr:FAD binding domain-containing protein [Chloroflexota bacterium]